MTAALEILQSFDLYSFCVFLVVTVLAVHLVPYFVDLHCIRSNGIPGPFWARFSDGWLGWVAVHGHRSEVVHSLHQKYGEYPRYAQLP